MGGQQVASFAFPSCIEIEDVEEEEEEEAPARNTGQTNRGRLWASNLSSRLLFPLAAVRKIRDGKAGGSCAQLRAMADNWVGHPCAPTERGQSQSASGMLRASQLSAERYMHHITAPWKQKFILQAAVGRSPQSAAVSAESSAMEVAKTAGLSGRQRWVVSAVSYL